MFNMKSHRNPTVMKHSFSRVPQAEIPRSSFDRSHGHKTTFDAGYLIPILLDEGLPGDTFKLKMTGFARLATPIVPLMDNMYMDTHFFAVPIRLVWNNWAKFNGEQDDPGDSTDFTVPQMTAHAPVAGSLSDYMGLPIAAGLSQGISHSSLFHRAYNLIWNSWFRDQNMQDSVVVDKDDGPDVIADYVTLRRGKRHDYFTSALPWPQKGDAVQMSLGTSAPVTGTVPGQNLQFRTAASGAGAVQLLQALGTQVVQSDTATVNVHSWQPAQSVTGAGIIADLSSAIGPTINALRQSFQIQKLLERDARGGTRYTEIVRAHFGVTSPDARLQRPEYLGGSSTPINITPIPQTTPDATTPLAHLAAIGVGLAAGHGFTASFTEHVLIIGLVSVRADLTYQQGMNRMWSRSTRYDFYWPALSHIGEQSVLRKEIWQTGAPANDDVVFGYQERYAEYRYKPSLITGLFRSNSPAPLDVWHLSQEFGTAPTLDDEFIQENPPVDRVIAVPAQPHFLFDSYFQMHCARPMPIYGVPGLIDHF